MFSDYLASCGLKDFKSSGELNSFVEESFARETKDLSAEEIRNLYFYKIPKLSPDGSCSIDGSLEEKPYDLRWTNPDPIRLWRLKQVINKLQKATQVDWLGIYRKIKKASGEEILLKESYFGRPSRPEFPLTSEFAKHSNNSTVGLTGKAILVKDVAKYQGPYYECDSEVKSEFCCPIKRYNNDIIGIIDAESFRENFFDGKKVLEIAKVSFDLGQINLGLP